MTTPISSKRVPFVPNVSTASKELPTRGRPQQRSVPSEPHPHPQSLPLQSPHALVNPWSPAPPHVHFSGNASVGPRRPSHPRRLPSSSLSAESIRSAWHPLRDRVRDTLADATLPPGPPPLPDAAASDLETLKQVDTYIEECAKHVAAARIRARTQRQAMQGLLEYAAHLHATQRLPTEERQYDTDDAQSMTAALRTILASLDVEFLHLQAGQLARDHSQSPPLPDLVYDGESDVDDDWVDVVPTTIAPS